MQIEQLSERTSAPHCPLPPRSSLRSTFFLLLPLVLFWLLLIYNLGAQWSIYEQYNYGWAVPFLSAYLLYRRLPKEDSIEEIKYGQQPTSDSLSAPGGEGQGEVASDLATSNFRFRISDFLRSPLFLLLLICLLAYAPTRWLHEANPTWRLTSWLWSLEVIAITLLALRLAETRKQKVQGRGEMLKKGPSPWGEGQGEGGISAFQRSSIPSFVRGISDFGFRISDFVFPLCFFLVAVPWPSALEGFLVNSFTSLDISATSELLGLFGIPAVQHGNTLEISSGLVGVDEACSGIRSFQATLMLSLFFGEFYRLTALRRAFCVLGGFAFSLIFNIGRTLLLVYVGSRKGINAISQWHDPAGTTILVLCFLSLWLLARLLCRLPSALRPPTSHVSTLQDSNTPLPYWFHFRFRHFGISAFLLLWLLTVEFGTQLWYGSNEIKTSEIGPGNPGFRSWSIRTDSQLLGFSTVPLPGKVSSQFRADKSIQAHWRDETGHPWQLYYFRWEPALSVKRRVAIQLAKTHGPTTCLPATGLNLQWEHTIHMQIRDMPLTIQQHLFLAEDKPVYVFYGIYEDFSGTQVLANRRKTALSRLHAALAGSRNYGQRFLELAVWGYDRPEDAREALQRELGKLISLQ